LVALATSGCIPYKDYLYSLPVTERQHAGEAIGIVADVFGIDTREPEVRWIVQDGPIRTEDGGDALGVTHHCVSWVWWPPLYGPNPETSTEFAHTVMAHEIAHCALHLYGRDGDADHSDPIWWGEPKDGLIGGLVGVAMDALEARGL
jgi:hypothetical protein